jgi:hypothetical protein
MRCSRRAEVGLVEGILGGWPSEVGRRIERFGTGGVAGLYVCDRSVPA